MLKIELIRFEADDIITQSIASSPDQIENGTTGGSGGSGGPAGESGNPVGGGPGGPGVPGVS